ncbi:aminotransferase class IV [Taylorella asinigenitalis]|uniref:D-alanine aminotransferase n=1 Tax=Taylorella asinigenitalis (strain MCE3) TaxID=1008459 RepID=G4QD32_TAYAM|nr:aminotransferase class IV [Taylorella asinigenitalis]AEP35849.1 D-alanine aminotransferase [Taylorella asinigenitalis MCE3]
MNMPMIQGVDRDYPIYLNGEMVNISEAKISVLDRGFIFGDGIYEVVPAYNRKPFRMEHHVARLMRSLKKIGLDSGKDEQFFKDLFAKLIQESPWDYNFIYLQVTRGVAARTHAFPNPPVPATIFAMSMPFNPPSQKVREEGIAVVSFDDKRWLHCDIKSISLLGNVLANQHAVDSGVYEVIQFRDGLLTEGSCSNFWIVKDGKFMGPLKDNLKLEGIRFGLFEELAQKAGVPFELKKITKEEVYEADEIMISSASKEVTAVTTLDGKPVGDGKPGPIYKKMRQAHDEVLAAL